jgi:hypothetical protein
MNRQRLKALIDGENTVTDDYYPHTGYNARIVKQPIICRGTVQVHGEGNTFVRTASMPNINGTITFKATIIHSPETKVFPLD